MTKVIDRYKSRTKILATRVVIGTKLKLLGLPDCLKVKGILASEHAG